jgi:hypothetical protein
MILWSVKPRDVKQAHGLLGHGPSSYLTLNERFLGGNPGFLSNNQKFLCFG